MIFIISIIITFLCVACANDSANKSPIDNMSDDVYQKIVQHYFAAQIRFEIATGEHGPEAKEDQSWITEHELYPEAEKYGTENNLHPPSFFPNPIHIEFSRNPEQFTETEQAYIDQTISLMFASLKVDVNEYERLKEKLKKELKIKDSYNMFDIGD